MFAIRRSRNVIYVFAFLAAAALAGWRGYSLYIEHDRILRDARLSAALAAENAVTGLEQSLDIADLLGEQVRSHIATAGGLGAISLPELRQFLAKLANATSIDDYILIVDAAGRPLALSNSVVTLNVNYSDRAWFRAHAADGADTYIGSAIKSRIGSAVIYTDSRRIAQNGVFEGVVNVASAAPAIKGTASRVSGDPVIELWTSDHRLLFSNFMDFDSHGNPAAASPQPAQPSMIEGVLQPHGSDVVTIMRKSPARSLVATATFRKSEVLAAWDAQVIASVALFVVAVLIGGLLVKVAVNLAEADLAARGALERNADALRSALAERDLVVKEIHHRVKNSLQLTSSLMQIQGREFDNEAVRAAFRETQQRLFAIGMVHDVLYQDDSKSSIDMNKYLIRLAEEIGRGNDAERRGIRTEFDIDPIELMPEQATGLGLCVAEVLMRIYGKAFLPNQSGIIDIELKQKSDNVELTIASDGQGLIKAAEVNQSLGARLIKTLAAQLHATYSMAEGIGAVFRLTFHSMPLCERHVIPN